jgi:cyclopropane fatty-acyl-phospholipid synthase-like methyltransferase
MILYMIDNSRPVLDIGAGQGRNTFFLARHGLEVHAIDPSQVGVDFIGETADSEGLKVLTFHDGFETFKPPVDAYSAVLLFGIIQILSWQEIEVLINRINSWTSDGSLVFLTAWSVSDPSCTRISEEWPRVGKNSFRKEQGGFRTYLEPDEILSLFHNFTAIHHWEGLGPWHSHGDRPPERHSRVEAVLKR